MLAFLQNSVVWFRLLMCPRSKIDSIKGGNNPHNIVVQPLSLFIEYSSLKDSGDAVIKSKKVRGGEIEITITSLKEVLYIGEKSRLRIVCGLIHFSLSFFLISYF